MGRLGHYGAACAALALLGLTLVAQSIGLPEVPGGASVIGPLTQEPVGDEPAAQDPWPARWELLQSLLAREDSMLRYELSENQRSLSRSLDGTSPELEAFRVGLFGAALDQPPADWQSVALPPGLSEAERQFALPFLPPGEARASVLIADLMEADGVTPKRLEPAEANRLQTLGFQAFVEEHDAFRAGPARRLAEALHASAGQPWSVYCLEGIARRSGDLQAAQAVVQQQLQTTAADAVAERIELLQRLAIVAAGAGDRDLELGSLGRALRLGGDDALQILGKTALFAGERKRARRLFGALLQRSAARGTQTPPWALRGWGLSLLPGASPSAATSANH